MSKFRKFNFILNIILTLFISLFLIDNFLAFEIKAQGLKTVVYLGIFILPIVAILINFIVLKGVFPSVKNQNRLTCVKFVFFFQ